MQRVPNKESSTTLKEMKPMAKPMMNMPNFLGMTPYVEFTRIDDGLGKIDPAPSRPISIIRHQISTIEPYGQDTRHCRLYTSAGTIIVRETYQEVLDKLNYKRLQNGGRKNG